MKLYLEKKTFSSRRTFIAKDESGCDRWIAQSEPFSMGGAINLYFAKSGKGSEVAELHRKPWSFLGAYNIELGGRTYEFVRGLTRDSEIKGLGWSIWENSGHGKYSVFCGQEQIMSVEAPAFSFRRPYELDIANPQNEAMCVCCVIALACCNSDRLVLEFLLDLLG